jgi:hypothetical protein
MLNKTVYAALVRESLLFNNILSTANEELLILAFLRVPDEFELPDMLLLRVGVSDYS